MKKKILIASLAIIAVLSATSSLTLSYFTDSSVVINNFTVGNVDVEAFRWHEANDYEVYSKESAQRLNKVYDEWLGRSENIVVAGKQINMMPYAVNAGNVDAYVRIRVYFPLELFDKDYIIYSYGGSSKLPDEEAGESEFIRNFANVTIDGKRYKRITFTRREALAAGHKTLKPVYQYVGLSTQLLKHPEVDISDFVDENGKLTVKVEADAVQAYGFSTPQAAFSYIDN